jgi:hypothetical protein
MIDSTTITLCLTKYRWAEFRSTKAGVKAHLRLTVNRQLLSLPTMATDFSA